LYKNTETIESTHKTDILRLSGYMTEAVVRRQLRMLRHGGWVELSRMGSVAAERQTAYDAAS